MRNIMHVESGGRAWERGYVETKLHIESLLSPIEGLMAGVCVHDSYSP